MAKLQSWVKENGLKVVVIFEGRDAAGKGGMIKTISQCLSPRICRVVALGKPTDKEETQWYFQRYVTHLPSAGEMVLFDRSWYNCVGVDRVMGFVSDAQYHEFLRSCPEFELMLIRSGIILIKYWFSISEEVQEKRFKKRIENPAKFWKISKMDIEGRRRWVDYSKAKDDMFKYTDTDESPWYVVDGNVKKHARINCISHLLSCFQYVDVLKPDIIQLPPLQVDDSYIRPPFDSQRFVKDIASEMIAEKN